MEGRLEHKIKTEINIYKLLLDMPEYVENYYLSLSSAKEPKTCLEYIRKVKYFINHINKKVEEITEKDLNKFFLYIQVKNNINNKKEETSYSYRKSYHTILSSFFNYLFRNNIININPMKNIDRPKDKDNVNHILLKSQDLNCILKTVDTGTSNKISCSRQQNWKERDKAILMLFMNTGMRETALSEINITDINKDNNTLVVIDKGHKYHEYYINEKLMDILNEWIAKRKLLLDNNDEEALFISNRRSRMTSKSISNIVIKYSKDGIGQAISPHKLRSAFCSILYEETGDIEFVRDCVGHSNVATTQRYIVKGADTKKKAANILKSKIG